MVSNASDDLPDPDSPVMTTSASRGIATVTSLRLCSRAPVTTIWDCRDTRSSVRKTPTESSNIRSRSSRNLRKSAHASDTFAARSGPDGNRIGAHSAEELGMIRWAPWEVGMSDLIPKPAGRRGAQVLDSVVRRVNGRGCLILLWAVAAAAELLALRPVL